MLMQAFSTSFGKKQLTNMTLRAFKATINDLQKPLQRITLIFKMHLIYMILINRFNLFPTNKSMKTLILDSPKTTLKPTPNKSCLKTQFFIPLKKINKFNIRFASLPKELD